MDGTKRLQRPQRLLPVKHSESMVQSVRSIDTTTKPGLAINVGADLSSSLAPDNSTPVPSDGNDSVF